MTTTVTGYSREQIVAHWAIVVLVAVQLLGHGGVEAAFAEGQRTGAYDLTPGTVFHFTVGSAILGLMMWRLSLRTGRGAPPAPEAEPAPVAMLSRGVHRAFYAVLLLLPVTGGIAWGTQSAQVANVHWALKTALIVLIAAHLGGALMHRLVWKSGVLDRMRHPQG